MYIHFYCLTEDNEITASSISVIHIAQSSPMQAKFFFEWWLYLTLLFRTILARHNYLGNVFFPRRAIIHRHYYLIEESISPCILRNWSMWGTIQQGSNDTLSYPVIKSSIFVDMRMANDRSMGSYEARRLQPKLKVDGSIPRLGENL